MSESEQEIFMTQQQHHMSQSNGFNRTNSFQNGANTNDDIYEYLTGSNQTSIASGSGIDSNGGVYEDGAYQMTRSGQASFTTNYEDGGGGGGSNSEYGTIIHRYENGSSSMNSSSSSASSDSSTILSNSSSPTYLQSGGGNNSSSSKHSSNFPYVQKNQDSLNEGTNSTTTGINLNNSHSNLIHHQQQHHHHHNQHNTAVTTNQQHQLNQQQQPFGTCSIAKINLKKQLSGKYIYSHIVSSKYRHIFSPCFVFFIVNNSHTHDNSSSEISFLFYQCISLVFNKE